MHIVRTIAWVLLTIVLVLFAVANWQPVEVLIWDNLVLETKLPMLILAAFLLGLLPMWLTHRIGVWRMRRQLHDRTTTADASYAAGEPPGAGLAPPGG